MATKPFKDFIMKIYFSMICLLFVLSAFANDDDAKEAASKKKKISPQTVTREKIRAFKDKNQKTVDALEDIEDEGTEEGDEEEEE